MKILNVLLHIVHVTFIVTSAFAWILPTTRPLHLIVQAAVIFSWFVLGFWKGWTYCLLTDVHWRLRRRLGCTDLPESYVQELVDWLVGKKVSLALVNRVVVAVFFGTTILSVALFLRSITLD